jgi:hypothetical protein
MSEPTRMYFERRLVSSDAQYVSPPDLRVGSVYFKVEFMDRELTIPILTPVVFAGCDLERTGNGDFYFQDFESFQRGVRFTTGGSGHSAVFETFSADDGPGVFEFDEALNCLLWCSLQRRERQE